MDDTDQSRASEAAATRKRRSSILKSQRPARTPFSELEFNVATPTDTAKSRRVSFSRRTGVAEFVTNEATTTWKNFYEEHNKSLESSGNDSHAKAFRQPIGHLGKRIFDQQFEEVEAIDLISSLNPSTSSNVSLNNINFMDQLESLDCMSDGKLAAPQSNCELSILPDGPGHSKLFGNDFTVTGIGEMSGRISVNFSAIQQIHEGDDLDEIERDLGRINNVVCQGPKDHNVSEYIEIDLNMTQVKNDECDMSITDSIHTPKVEDVFKNRSVDAKSKGNKDWVADKENIAINPYATPLETDNFAINDEPNQVLVFDGKRLTLETEKPEKDYRKTLLPNPSSVTPQRKTIILNVNDDLPNFADNLIKMPAMENRPNICNDLTPISNKITRELIKSDDDIGHISLTRALSSNIVVPKTCSEMVSEEDIQNISMTQALSGKIIIDNPKPVERRQTVKENNSFDISITQALPTNVIQNDNHEKNNKRKTIVFNDDDGNISMTNVVSSKIILEQKCPEKRKTIIFDDDSANISITQAIPANIVMNSQSKEKNRTMIYEDSMGNISVTQAVPTSMDLAQKCKLAESRKSLLIGFSEKERDIELVTKDINEDHNVPEYIAVNMNMTEGVKNDECDMSITDVIPSPKIQDVINTSSADRKGSESKEWVTNKENIGIKQAPTLETHDGGVSYEPDEVLVFDGKRLVLETVTPDKNNRKTLLCDDPIVAPQRKPVIKNDDLINIVDNLNAKPEIHSRLKLCNDLTPINNKIKDQSINESNDDIGQISPKKVLPSNIVIPENGRNLISEADHSNISMTQALPGKIIIERTESFDCRQTAVKENDPYDISITQALSTNIILNDNHEKNNKRKTIVYNDDEGNISMTNVVSTNFILEHINTEKRKTIIFDSDDANISLTQSIPASILLASQSKEKNSAIVNEEVIDDLSVTQAVSTNVVLPQQPEVVDRRRTIVYEDNSGDITITQVLPQTIILGQVAKENTEILVPVKSMNQTIPAEEASLQGKNAENTLTQAPPCQVSSGIDSINVVSNMPIINDTQSDNNSLHVKDSWEKANEFLLSGVSTNVDDDVQSVHNMEETREKEINSLDDIQSGFTDLIKRERNIAATDVGDAEMSRAEVMPKVENFINTESVKNIILKEDIGNISLSKPIPANLKAMEQNNSIILNKSENMELDLSDKVVSNQKNFLLYQTVNELMSDLVKPMADILPYKMNKDLKRKENSTVCKELQTDLTTSSQNDIDIELTSNQPSNYEIEDNSGDITITQVLPQNIILGQVAKENTEILVPVKSMNQTIPAEEASLQGKNAENTLTQAPPCQVSSGIDSINVVSNMPIINDTQSDNNSLHVKDSWEKANEFLLSGVSTNVDDDVQSVHNMEETREKEINSLDDIQSGFTDLIKRERNIAATDVGDAEMSRAEVMPKVENFINTESVKNIILKEDIGNISLSKPIPANLKAMEQNNSIILNKSENMELDLSDKVVSNQKNFLLYQTVNELMSDLVKPMADILPYKMNKDLKRKENSTVCKELQTDLTTSSQNDIDIELTSNQPSNYEIEDNSGDITITQVLPQNIILGQVAKENTEILVPVKSMNQTIPAEEASLQGKNAENTLTQAPPCQVSSGIDSINVVSNMPIINDTQSDNNSLHVKDSWEKANEFLLSGVSTNVDDDVQSVHNMEETREKEINSLDDIQSGFTDLIKRERNIAATDVGEAEMSRAEVMPKVENFINTESVKNILLKEDIGNISLTKPIPANFKAMEQNNSIILNKSENMELDLSDKVVSNQKDFLLYQTVKELMSDLVKPMADILPYKMNKDLKGKENSTVCKELQTDLTTSSQIDIDIELTSNQPSNYEIGEVDSYGFQRTNHSYNVPDLVTQPNSKELRMSKMDTTTNMHTKVHSPEISREASFNRQILVFDHQNPLNNILLRPVDNADAHRYDPITDTAPQLLKSDESICLSTCNQSCQISVDNKEDENSVGVNTNSKVGLSGVDNENWSNSDSRSMSDLKKPLSRDCSVDAYIAEVQDIEVNTVIVMKGNKELLDATSSLTLVDEPISKSITTSSECSNTKKMKKSPLRVVFDIKDQDSSSNMGQLGSDTISQEETIQNNRPKKRSHLITPVKSPCTNFNDSKPNMKMQKLSNSPKSLKSPEKHAESNKFVLDNINSAERKRILKPRNKPDSSITVQHLITEYNLDSVIKDSINDLKVSPKSKRHTKPESQSKLECSSSEVMSSCTSSKNLKTATDISICSASSSMKSSSLGHSEQSSRTDWHPECSVNLPSDCDSGVNIVAKIDMLPFMGSHECEWDISAVDTWCFRLLHGRLRLTIRLEHRHDNAIRTRVRADTRVTDLNIETVQQDKKNPMATVCIRFAAETFRYLASHRGAVREARDVPQLLRRGAALARTALRWARAMYDAKVRLAYTLDCGGHLALKVANIPLRSVWEVSMDLELVVENARETPWPRACNVRVTRVVSDIIISADDVQRVISNIPKDWGHVPKTLWRIFRYLKNKTVEDEVLLSSQHF